jgi:eukaryotic-like serine/threonine-protein kinase
MAPHRPDRPRRVVAGRVQLVRRLAVGGSGAVWAAWDRGSRRYAAAKVLDHGHGDALARFVQEQGLRIRHPHVVAPYGWAGDDDRVVLLMDLVRGGSAADLLRRHGPLPADYVAVLLDQLLQALAAVHRSGVVHRDVKPANLLLEPTGTDRPWLRLADFGVATHLRRADLVRAGAVVGTDGYLAPEAVAGEAATPRLDLYAAGVTAARLLTGRGGVDPEAAGRLGPLLSRLTADDPAQRPAGAVPALAELRSAGVPSRPTWRAVDIPPEVGDRVGRLSRWGWAGRGG